MTNLKKMIAACAACMAVLVTGCNKSGEEVEKLQLTISLENLTSTSVDMTVTPNTDGTYYYDVLGKSAYDNMMSEGTQTFIDNEIQRREEAYSLSREEVLAKLLSSGASTFSFKSLSAATDYYAVAFGVNSDGTVSTEVVLNEFNTPAVAPSDNELEITIKSVYDDGADYTVTPSDKEATYLVDIWSKSIVDELGDGETMRYFIEYNSFMIPMLSCRDVFDYTNEQTWQPNREYYVIAFGYADGEPTTKLYKKEFKTTGGDPANCAFTFKVDNIKTDNAVVTVTPSDKKVVYIWNVFDMKRFNGFKQTYKTDEETLAYILDGYIKETMESEGIKLQQAVESLGRWSGYADLDGQGSDQEKIFGLSGGEEYIVWSVAVDDKGKPLGKFYTTKFTTPTE